MTKKPPAYAVAVEQAQALLAQARLADPNEHFPYKHEEVSALVAENPPAGPEGPDDDRVRVEDFMTQKIADATRDYVEAQANALKDPSEHNQELVGRAAEALEAARAEHRANRPAGPTINAIRAPRAGE